MMSHSLHTSWKPHPLVDGRELGAQVDASIASRFSSNVESRLFAGIEELILDSMHDLAKSKCQIFRRQGHWFDERWHILSLDSNYYRLGMFLDHLTSTLQVIIDDYFKAQRPQRASARVSRPGKIRYVRVIVSPTLGMDHKLLCHSITERIDEIYKIALVDYRSALKDYCLESASDELYDVLRKSKIPELIQRDITLYSVFDGIGRHLPSIDRVQEITTRLYRNTRNMDVCPFRLATEFFLGALDGRRYELYTHKAFREGQAVVAPRNKFSGESYVRLATEAFVSYREGIVQPVVRSGDSLLISAIYPAQLVRWVLPEIEREKGNFARVIDHIQGKNRDVLNKLREMTENRSTCNYTGIALTGEFLGGFVKGLIN